MENHFLQVEGSAKTIDCSDRIRVEEIRFNKGRINLVLIAEEPDQLLCHGTLVGNKKGLAASHLWRGVHAQKEAFVFRCMRCGCIGIRCENKKVLRKLSEFLMKMEIGDEYSPWQIANEIESDVRSVEKYIKLFDGVDMNLDGIIRVGKSVIKV